MATLMRWCALACLLEAAVAQQVSDLSSLNWNLKNAAGNISIPAKIPSQAHLDLAANGVIGQIEYGLNDFELRWIWQENWTYSTTLEGANNAAQTYLLFQGLDTFTSIELCDQHIASTNNQFRQYYFDVTKVLDNCSNPKLSINFGSAPKIAADIANEPGQETWPFGVEIVYEIPNRQFIRKEQNDFGWDWGPAYAPAGPWLPVYLIELNQNQVYARNTLVDVYKQGQRNNYIPDQSQPWILNASIDVLGSLPEGATLSYSLQDASNASIASGSLRDVNQTSSVITGSVEVPNDLVDLWWPVGFGAQNLYYITIDIKTSANVTLTSVTKRIGFRTIVLNEWPVTEEQIALGVAPGNNWHFEVNGYPFFAKGSNFIPPDVFWPRVNETSIRNLFNAVVAGNQNMLRVWASGAYSPDFLYDIADELGILLWSEFEFGDALYPVNSEFIENVYEEVNYQVRRINHHPSLAYWAGGNELENLELYTVQQEAPKELARYVKEYEELFLATIFPAVFENSRSISYAPSSTSNGFISLNFTDAPYFDERFENTTGGIYGDTDHYEYNSTIAFALSSYPVGRFSNEFGYHSMPSLQTWQEYIPEDQLEFNSTYVLLRNRHYPPGNLSTTNYLNSSLGMGQMTWAVEQWYPSPDKTNPIANFSAWCWATQVFQADYYGAQIQFYRRGSGMPQRTLGSLYWQLEDQWAAPTWAGIEVTGRWKFLHYRAKDLYSNIIVSPFYNLTNFEYNISVTSDLWEEAKGTVDATYYYWNGTEVPFLKGLTGYNFTVGALNSTQVYATNIAETLNKTLWPDVVMRMNVTAEGRLPNSNETTIFTHTNWWHAAPLSLSKLVDPGLQLSHDPSSRTFTVIAQKGVSAWTWLDYPSGVLVTFADNGFWLGKGESKTLTYNAIGDTTNGAWLQNVTVQSLWNNTLPD